MIIYLIVLRHLIIGFLMCGVVVLQVVSSGMEFAREHLKQLGWQEGAGLGKECHGITEALKPKLKFDTSGIGHDLAREFTHAWWSEAYNTAANNFSVTEAQDGCQVTTKTTKKKKCKKQKREKTAYSNFIAGGTLVGATIENGVDEVGDPGGAAESAALASLAEGDELSDEQLLAACGGRTAHKGARHGHKMDGKLARILAQEASSVSSSPAQSDHNFLPTPPSRKRKKCKRKHNETDQLCDRASGNPSDNNGDAGKIKHKKKRVECEDGHVQTPDNHTVPKKKKKRSRGENC